MKASKALSKIKSKATRPTTGDGVPHKTQGRDGDITFRLVDGEVKLYGKFRGKWYGISLS
jgi:hypothetical protein